MASLPGGMDPISVKLILSTSVIHTDMSANFHGFPVLRQAGLLGHNGSPHHTPQGSFIVLQGEIKMTRSRSGKVRDLARDQEVPKSVITLERLPYVASDVGHRPGLWFCG